MNERFINLCVEHGGESWLSSEPKDLEELAESFAYLRTKDGRGSLTLSSTSQAQRNLLAFVRSLLLWSPWYLHNVRGGPGGFQMLGTVFQSLDLCRHQISENILPLQIIFSISGFTRERWQL